jgi:hypothetical protein
MTDDALATDHPDVVYFLSTYVLGDTTLAGEVADFVKVEGVGRAETTLDELDRLLADGAVPEPALDSFARSHSSRYLGSGRATLQRLADELRALRDHASAPGPDSPPAEVVDRLADWLEEQGMLRPDNLPEWSWSDADGAAWVVLPPAGMDVLFVVTPTAIRAIQPALESVDDALRDLGL